MTDPVNRKQIAAGLKALGILPGDLVMVHSSLKSLGKVDGGAETVIDAFLDVIGPGGTLAMPTNADAQGASFDAARTPASTGLIPETFRRRPGVVRSLHPTHSVAAFGPKAKWLTEGHEKLSAVNRHGPYGKLMDLNAAYTFVGTGVAPCTLFHGFEEWMGLPYLEYEHYVLHFKDKVTGEEKVFRGKKGLGGHRDFYLKPPKVEVVLRQAGLLAEAQAGNATLTMFRALPAAEAVLNRLKGDPALLLCGNEKCEYCVQARESMVGWRPEAKPEEILAPVTLARCGKALSVNKPAKEDREMKVRLEEMTWREAQARLEKSDVAILPMGPIEGHGPHVPLGCDAYIAEAFGLLLARKVGGVVLPSLTYNYSGGTATFRGTVSIPMDVQIAMTKAIVRSLWANGFRRIAIASVHGPNGIPIGNALRTVFEEDNIPAIYLNPWPRIDAEKLKARAVQAEEGYKEATLAFGAMKILGKDSAIPDVRKIEDRQQEADSHQLPEWLRKLHSFGPVGFHYTDELQHIPPRAGIDPDLGVALLEEVAEQFVPVFDYMAQYLSYLETHPRTFVR
jgi:aminoglycoside 3-N-acetyltransferase